MFYEVLNLGVELHVDGVNNVETYRSDIRFQDIKGVMNEQFNSIKMHGINNVNMVMNAEVL